MAAQLLVAEGILLGASGAAAAYAHHQRSLCGKEATKGYPPAEIADAGPRASPSPMDAEHPLKTTEHHHAPLWGTSEHPAHHHSPLAPGDITERVGSAVQALIHPLIAHEEGGGPLSPAEVLALDVK